MGRLCVFLAALAAVACVESLDPLPLDVTIDASKVTTVVGDSVEFLVKAQGGSLVGVTIDYGDGITDIFETAGARTAQVRFKHPYTATGVYDVQGGALDASMGQKLATVRVTIN